MSASAESASSGAAAPESTQPPAIDLSTLSVEQLDMLNKQGSQDLQALMENYKQLSMAKARFERSGASLAASRSAEPSASMLVPISNSVFVPGTLDTEEPVLVDIGTGYFVQKSVTQAEEIMEKKVKFLTGNLNRLRQHIEVKQQELQMIKSILSAKVNAA